MLFDFFQSCILSFILSILLHGSNAFLMPSLNMNAKKNSMFRLHETSIVSPEFSSIKNIEVLKAIDGSSTPIKSLWSDNDRAILICFRSFG